MQAAGGSGAGDGGHGQAVAVLGARASNAGEAGPWLEPWPRTPINEVVCWT